MPAYPPIDEIVAALKQTADTAIVPRFRALQAGEIHEKGKDDPVTIADREAEDLLTQSLPRLLPGSVVVGEEAVSADPAVLDRLGEDAPVWLVDPVDGTANFIAGKETFGVMTALVVRGEPVLAVIYAPVTGMVVAAEKGAGAFLDGVRLYPPAEPAVFDRLRGAVMTHFMPKPAADVLNAGAAGLGQRLRGLRACAFEYPAIATGERDFVLFSKTMPWDHAPGAVILGETGGSIRYLDGTLYTPLSQRRGLLVARSAAVWEAAAAGLFPAGDPLEL